MRNLFHAVGSGVGFDFGKESFVLNTNRERAAAVVVGDINVDAIYVPHLPQASLAVPWNGWFAVEVSQATENGVEALGCLGVWECRIQSELQMD